MKNNLKILAALCIFSSFATAAAFGEREGALQGGTEYIIPADEMESHATDVITAETEWHEEEKASAEQKEYSEETWTELEWQANDAELEEESNPGIILETYCELLQDNAEWDHVPVAPGTEEAGKDTELEWEQQDLGTWDIDSAASSGSCGESTS